MGLKKVPSSDDFTSSDELKGVHVAPKDYATDDVTAGHSPDEANSSGEDPDQTDG